LFEAKHLCFVNETPSPSQLGQQEKTSLLFSNLPATDLIFSSPFLAPRRSTSCTPLSLHQQTITIYSIVVSGKIPSGRVSSHLCTSNLPFSRQVVLLVLSSSAFTSDSRPSIFISPSSLSTFQRFSAQRLPFPQDVFRVHRFSRFPSISTFTLLYI